jgi:hypothetical protein
MKEATGELNATIAVVLAVGVLMAFFYYTLWPIIKNNFEESTQCSKAICEKCPSGDCETVECYSKKDETKKFECVYKG